LRNRPGHSISSTVMINYFAYGSNMCTARIRERLPNARAKGIARLAEHSLRWHKRSIDGSGKCDAFRTGNQEDEVIGVVFELPDDEKRQLDAVEGLGKGYDEKTVMVNLEDGSRSGAVLYVATSSAIDSSLVPYDWYKEHVQCGAKDYNLPERYRARIDSVPTKTDPNSTRAAKERHIRLTFQS
jgi:gamma-glutamylcyclotransferase